MDAGGRHASIINEFMQYKNCTNAEKKGHANLGIASGCHVSHIKNHLDCVLYCASGF